MVQLMLACPSSSFTVTMSTPSRVSREAKVCRNMCHVTLPSPARFTAARSAPFTRDDDLECRIVQGKAQRLVTFLHEFLQALLLDVHLRPLQIENIARSQASVDRKQDQVAEVRG